MIRIGKIVASHGLQGSIIITHILGKANWLKKDDTIFVEMNKGSFIPFFVQQCKAANFQEYNIQLEDIATVEQAKKLIAKHIYVNEEVLTQFAQKSPLLWIGCVIIDAHYGNLGAIADMLQTSAQWIAKLNYQGKEVLVPMVEQTIVNINLKKREIQTTLPVGIIEVYL